MSNKILFIFEGERTEKQIADNLTKHFIGENSVIQCAYCANIYRLYKDISEDEDLDTFSLLKELPSNEEILARYSRNDFAEIYMFFDYDGHDTIADDKTVAKLLYFFNEETLSGKLFISYPMVEAVKHFSDIIDFRRLTIKIAESTNYKQIVDSDAKNELKDFRKYTKEIWVSLIELHLRKMNYIITRNYSLPTENSSQNYIFNMQLENYINIDSTVAVLSSFPIFLFDYYGYNYISKLLSE